jgi:hypothetical protein
MQFHPNPRRACARRLSSSALLVLVFTSCAAPQTKTQPNTQQPAPAASTPGAAQKAPQPNAAAKPRTPSETVREFSRALRERRFREAFALTVLKPAIEQMSAEEFEDMRPEIEKLVPALREDVQINGEQISGDAATVFARVSNDPAQELEKVDLVRAGDGWLVGDRAGYDALRGGGKEYLFKARVETHHDEMRKVLDKIANAEAVYAAQNAGRYAELPALAQGEMSMRLGLREDVEAVVTMGYRLALSLASDGRSYKVNAEPARYGHTGRLSYYMDATGRQEKDNGGKPFNPPPAKKKS